MSTIFSKIIKGDIPCHKIAESEDYFAFLDISPLAEGHTLVVPKVEVDYIYDLDDKVLTGLHLFAKRIAKALEAEIVCKRVGVLVIGTEVPHAHIHLIPFKEEKQMAITSERLNISQDAMRDIASKVAARLSGNSAKEKVTLVFGASTNPERYSYKAMRMLSDYKHEVVAVGGREGDVNGLQILTGHPVVNNVDTVTMYMGESRQEEHEDYILSLRPRRIIFNPGAENTRLATKARLKGIEVENACTLVMLRTDQY